METLVGSGHLRIVDTLVDRVSTTAAGHTAEPRIVVLEGASGTGKSRIVRELYRLMRRDFDHEGYWPSLSEAPEANPSSHDPLPGRKRIGPPVRGFVWPPDSRPGFGWWQFQCERMVDGHSLDVVAEAKPDLERHIVPLTFAWRRAANMKQRIDAKRDDLEDAARQALLDGGLEAASQLLSAANIAIPGLGTAVSWLIRGFEEIRTRRDEQLSLTQATDLGNEATRKRRSVSSELADMIVGVSHPNLPAVVVIEDLHLMNDALAHLIELVSAPNRAHPVIVVGTAWPDHRDNLVYTRWRESHATTGRVQTIAMPYLPHSELTRIVLAHAPNTRASVAAKAAEMFANPLALEATLSLPAIRGLIDANAGGLPERALEFRDTRLESVYREQFWGLPMNMQLALAVAAGSTPRSAFRVWPFVCEVVSEVAARCTEPAAAAPLVLDNLLDAAERKVWLVAVGLTHRFRESLQVHVAHEHLRTVVGTNVADSLTNLTAAVLTERLDTRRGDGYILETSTESSTMSRWLLDIAPRGTRGEALLAAAYQMSTDLAASYQFHEAVTLMEDKLTDSLPSHPHLMVIRRHLATWLAKAGRAQQSVEALRSLLQEQRVLTGESDPETLATHGTLLYILGRMGKPNEAIAEFPQLISAQQDVLGSDHPDTLLSRYRFAGFRGEVGHVSDAISEFAGLVTTLERVLGPRASATMISRRALAWFTGESGDTGGALRMLEDLLIDQEESLGRHHPNVLTTRSQIASMLCDALRFDEAAAAYQTLADDFTRVLGPDARDTLCNRNNLAWAVASSGRVDEAVPMLRELLVDHERVMGPDDPGALEARRNLAWLVGVVDDVPKAIFAFEALLADRRRLLGASHPQTLNTRGDLAQLKGRSGEKLYAISKFDEIIALQTEVLKSATAPDVLDSRSHRAWLLGEIGRFDEAIRDLELLLQGRRRNTGPDSAPALTVLEQIAHWQAKAGRFDSAVATTEQLLANRIRIRGAGHPETAETRNRLRDLRLLRDA